MAEVAVATEGPTVVDTNDTLTPPPSAADEDESYLYGDEPDATNAKEAGRKEEEGEGEKKDEEPSTPTVKVKQEKKSDSEDGEFEDESEEEDDHIQVHIGEVNPTGATSGPYTTPVNWKKPDAAAVVKPVQPAQTQGQKKLDLNAVGVVNGQSIYDYDVDASDDKPWRKPGADITDYFNYGFTEDTWKLYCEKQRRTKMELAAGGLIQAPFVVAPNIIPQAIQTAPIEYEVMPDGRIRQKPGPPPDRKPQGSIHVIGSDVDRRKQKEDELLALALGGPRLIAPQQLAAQRPIYQALPGGGTVVYNQPFPGQQFIQPQVPTSMPQASSADSKSSQSDHPPSSVGGDPVQVTSSMPQQIPHMGGMPMSQAGPAPIILQGGIRQPGMQQLLPGQQLPSGMFDPNMPPGIQQMMPGGPQIFPPPNVGMEFQHPDQFAVPGQPPSGWDGGRYNNSDSDYNSSDGENRRHSSRRREASRHRRHRDRSDKDRDRSKARDRDRSSSRRKEGSSRSESSRKKHSRSSSSVRGEGETDRKKSRKTKSSDVKEESSESKNSTPPIKQEPAGE